LLVEINFAIARAPLKIKIELHNGQGKDAREASLVTNGIVREIEGLQRLVFQQPRHKNSDFGIIKKTINEKNETNQKATCSEWKEFPTWRRL
jgi:hypothetical protein